MSLTVHHIHRPVTVRRLGRAGGHSVWEWVCVCGAHQPFSQQRHAVWWAHDHARKCPVVSRRNR